MAILEGKVAIITGAARGQGEATARLFVTEGARVVLTDIQRGAARHVASTLGDKAIGLDHDVRDEATWQIVVATTLERFGKVDVLVNNAGVLAVGGLDKTASEDLENVFRINVIGAFLGMKTIADHITKPGGSIINVASAVGLKGSAALIAYTTSKWALRGLSKSVALALAPSKVRVNTICPGVIDTPMLDVEGSQEFMERAKQSNPFGRPGTPDEIASVSAFLASDQASFMTGSEVVVDGGGAA